MHAGYIMWILMLCIFFRIDKVTKPLFKNDNLFQAWKWTSNPISKLREKTLSFGLFDLICFVLFCFVRLFLPLVQHVNWVAHFHWSDIWWSWQTKMKYKNANVGFIDKCVIDFWINWISDTPSQWVWWERHWWYPHGCASVCMWC